MHFSNQDSFNNSNPIFPYHAFVSVGQEQDDPALSHPLLLTATDELVNDALRRVVEIAELGLPDDEGVGVGHGVAELEAHDAVLGQGAVAHHILGLVR